MPPESRPRSPRGNDPPAATVIARSNTAIAASRLGQAGLPTRALTVRRPRADDALPCDHVPKPSEQTTARPQYNHYVLHDVGVSLVRLDNLPFASAHVPEYDVL